ncbi:MAG TPA: hypothetical protein VMT64_00980 [Candidatus Binataceae bacterium]|nr:hypothetical protein [Candidatus Binataceae bacterium]
MDTDADMLALVSEAKGLLEELMGVGEGELERAVQVLDDIERIVRALRRLRPAPTFKRNGAAPH